MHRLIRFSVLTSIALALLSFSQGINVASAQSLSLFQRRSPSMTNSVNDKKAMNPGDLLFVTIQERSDVENIDQRSLRKQNSSNSSAEGSYSGAGGFGSGNGSVGFGQESAGQRRFDGNTQFISEREFSDRLTVRVLDRYPSGNLLIAGSRDLSLEGDGRRLILTGIVRQVDILPNNSISSQLISNLKVTYQSSNASQPESRFINQGWLGRKLNKWWPH